jgi:MSHA biogenesis protein MshQ
MTYLKKLLFLLSIIIFLPLAANAASYSLVSGASCGSGSTCPVCSGGGGSWSVSGANFTCSGSISLASGDTVSISASGSITANASIALNNNTIGSATRTINLISNSNTITTTGSSSVFGSITANSGTISLASGNITGSVFSACCAITTNGTVIGGSVTSNSGTISITGGSIGGSVTTGCCTITANNTIISGSISANTNITLTNSTIGSSSSPVSVTSSNGSITLNTSTNAYGTLTAPSWSTVYVNSGSTVSGTCIPNSTPANACNSSPVLLGSWRMDELSWNGTAAEVKDSSGSGNHGRARVAVVGNSNPSTTSGTPAYTAGSKSTCRYGAFDGTGSPTRAYSYVELSGFPTLPNGFTFAAWIRSTNASAQHQRILVRDDAQNGWGLSLADGTDQPKLRFFARNITNNGAVTGQGSNPSCGVFCIDTNSVLTSNAWYYVASVVDTSAKTITLYVYNASGVLQAKTTGAYSGTWTDGTGTAAIGGETSASSEGQQTSWHFLGNIDEVNIYSGALTQTNIESLLPSVRTCPAPDHYELVMSANNLTCLGADVTVRACADSISPCNNIDYTVNGNVTLFTDAGSLNTTALNLVSGSGTTKLFYPAAVNNALAKVTLSGETTIATNARKCCLGGTCSVSSSCTTTFNTAGFIFPNSATGTSNNISNQIAGVTSPTNTAYVRALQTNATTGACMARFTSPQTVKMAYKCVNPATCSLTTPAQTLTLNGTVISANANSVNPSVYSDVNLSFDANGSASIPINYSDVGQIKLLAQVIKTQTPTDPAITLVGESNLFVVKPHSVVVSSVSTVAGANNPGASSEAGAANNFVSAGTPFKVSVQALNELKKVTPNFGKETSSQSQFITLVTNSLVYPSPALGTATELTYTPNTFSAASAGTYANPTVVWPQVGSMTIMPGLSDYLGAGSVTGEASSTIGRFYPDHYRVVSASSIVTNGCGSFSYMGQPNLQIKPYITAHSAGASGVIVSNYDNQTLGYGSPSILAAPVYAAQNNTNGTNHGSRLKIDAGKWVKGVYSDTLKGTFTRQATGEPEPPYDSLRIGISAMADLSPTPFDLVNPTPATLKDMLEGNAIAFKDPSDATKNLLNLRYGRLRLDDASGPETVALPVNFITEYWTGSYFSLNTNDSCTQVPRAAITYLPKGNLMTLANFSVDLTGGTTQGTYTTIAPTYIGFNAGSAGHMFTAPTNGAQGKFVVNVDLTSLPWLGFDWNQNGNYLDADLLKANYEFGSYRGNDRVIYWREKLQ